MKNKLSVIALIFGLALGNCVALDMTGLSDSYTGKEAKKKIKDAAYLSDTWAYGLIYGPPNDSILTTVDQVYVSIFTKLDDEKYYAKADVDKCASDITNFGILLISDASTTVLISSNCSGIKPNGSILADSP